MQWPLIILAYVMLALQIGVAPYVALHGAGPNLPLIAVLYVAVQSRRDRGLMGCFFIGLLQDLLSAQPPGVFALAYGLVAMLAGNFRPMLLRRQVIASVAVALAGGLITAMVLLLHGWIQGPRIAAGVEFTRAIYTAALTPIIFWMVDRALGLLGTQSAPRRSTSTR